MSSIDFVQIFDTTLRDGEQSPGATMNVEVHAGVALRLARLRRRHDIGMRPAHHALFEAQAERRYQPRGCAGPHVARFDLEDELVDIHATGPRRLAHLGHDVQLRIVEDSTISLDDDRDMDAIYEILDRRHNTGITDLAARHNEHQP